MICPVCCREALERKTRKGAGMARCPKCQRVFLGGLRAARRLHDNSQKHHPAAAPSRAVNLFGLPVPHEVDFDHWQGGYYRRRDRHA